MPGAYARPSKSQGPDPEEDAFLNAVRRAITWVEENTRVVVLCLAVIAIAVAGAIYYVNYSQDLEARSASQLSNLRAQLASGGDTAVVSRLQGFVDRFAGTPAALEGRLMLAEQQLAGGNTEAAIETVRPVMDRPVDTPTGFSAHMLMADALDAAGRPEEALETLRAPADRARFGFQRRKAAAERARILVDQGRLEEAIAIYERLVDEAEATDAQELYAVRLGEARAMAASGSGAGAASGEPSGDASDS